MIRRILMPVIVLLSILAVFYGIRLSRQHLHLDFLTLEERYWLDANDQRITVALDPRWQPDQSVDDQQIYEGIIADFLALLERKLGVRFMRLHTQSWEQILEAEGQGKIDIHPVLVKSADRSNAWLFTEPYFRIPVVVVMRASLKDRFSLDTMHLLRMGVGHGYGIDAFIQEHVASYKLVPVESDRFGLIKAAIGEIDLMVTDLASASYYIEREGLTNLRLAATLGSLYEFSFASRADRPILNSILNKALTQITREERRRIYDRWIVFDVQPFYQSRSFWYTAGVVALAVAVLLSVIMVWNAILKVEVAIKTRALQNAHNEMEQRVQERTAQLAEANLALQYEITERAAMTKDILHISGNERARIGRDLHDSIGQQMVGISFLSQALSGRLQEVHPSEVPAVNRISDQINDLVVDMKRIVRGLLPVDVMDKGLVVAIQQLVRETAEHHNIDCRFVCLNEDACGVQDNAMATNLYRIVQEATNNALKHAKNVKNIEITLDVQGKNGNLRIKDDGAGISDQRSHCGMGLKIMRYRAELAGGSLSFNRLAEGGSEVFCSFNADLDLNSTDVL